MNGIMKGKIKFQNAADLFEYYELAPVEEMEISSSYFDDEEFMFFIRDAFSARMVEWVECEGRKVFPWHRNNSFFMEVVEYDTTETPMGEDEWRQREPRTIRKWLGPAEYVPAFFAGKHVYATLDGGKTKLLVTPRGV